MDKKNDYGFLVDSENLLYLMNKVEFRKFMYQFLLHARIFQSSYDGQNSHNTAFNEGRKYIGILLYAQINEICPELVTLMNKENKEDFTVETTNRG